MRFASAVDHVAPLMAAHGLLLRCAHQRGLAVWVGDTILAPRACQTAGITALLLFGTWHPVRQYLRESVYNGADKVAPCHPQVDVALCFVPLRWVLH